MSSFILKKKPKKLIAIEKDNLLATNLQSNFNDQMTIINKDILSPYNFIKNKSVSDITFAQKKATENIFKKKKYTL